MQGKRLKITNKYMDWVETYKYLGRTLDRHIKLETTLGIHSGKGNKKHYTIVKDLSVKIVGHLQI